MKKTIQRFFVCIALYAGLLHAKEENDYKAAVLYIKQVADKEIVTMEKSANMVRVQAAQLQALLKNKSLVSRDKIFSVAEKLTRNLLDVVETKNRYFEYLSFFDEKPETHIMNKMQFSVVDPIKNIMQQRFSVGIRQSTLIEVMPCIKSVAQLEALYQRELALQLENDIAIAFDQALYGIIQV